MPERQPVSQGNRVRRRRGRGRGDMPEATAIQEGTAVGLIALQQRIGNRAVQTLQERRQAQRIFQSPDTSGALLQTENLADIRLHSNPMSIMRQGLLNAGEIASAIHYTDNHYDSRSVRIIQIVTGADVDGDFGEATADAVAEFQDANPPLLVDGKVGENTLNVIVPERVAAGRHEHAIQLVADFYDLNTTRDTLSVHFDAGLLGTFNTTFQSGNLRVIQVGSAAFASADDLRDAIRDALAVAAPPGPVAGARPTHLTTAQEQRATAFNRTTYRERRSILGIQGLVGTEFDADFGPDTAERIAEFQDSHALTVDGMVGEETLGVMVAELDTAGQQEAAIRMIMDFYNMREFGSLLDISFDAAVTDNAVTDADIPGPSTIRIGPPGFAQGFEGLVHTMAHELEHVRQNREGIADIPISEFLGEAVEILSEGMPEEGTAGFMNDARRALTNWNNMPVGQQRDNFARFEEVRDQVRARFNNFTPAEQAAHQATIDGYNAVVEPVAVP